MNRFCLIGEHLSHSLSAVIHARLFELLGISGSYELREIPREESNRATGLLADEGYDGFNVTIPYKEVILPQLDSLSEEAGVIGAVNTVFIRRENGLRLEGYNTDYAGFGRMLRQAGIEVRGRGVAVLGIGGAFRAVAAYLLDQGVQRLYAVTRRPEQEAKKNTSDPRLQVISYDNLKELSGALLVNSTPVGMFPHREDSPVDKTAIARFDAAADLIYNPKETEFLRLAREMNKPAVNGMTMLVAQAVAAEEIWLGRSIDEELIPRLSDEMSDFLKKGRPGQ